VGKMEGKSFEVKQINEREIWIGENIFSLGEDNILYETIVGESDDEMGIALEEATNKLKKMVKGKVDILVDVNRAGKPTHKTRERARKSFEDEKVGKVVLFGMNPVGRVITSFVMGVTGKKDMRLFKSKDEALVWLKE
jgi:hypothetical protein